MQYIGANTFNFILRKTIIPQQVYLQKKVSSLKQK